MKTGKNSPSPLWTHEEHVITFNLYCRTPFGRMHRGNPDVIALAAVLGRTPSAIARKLSNFARLDPTLQRRGIKGLDHGAKGEELVWEEFFQNWELLAAESARLMSERTSTPIEESLGLDAAELPQGATERQSLVSLRVKQDFFRASVLAAYNFRCCVTGISEGRLLNASHIVPWSVDKFNRINPQNGLCLNALHDRAFDRGLITVTPDMRVKVAKVLLKKKQDENLHTFINQYNGKEIMLPAHFVPDQSFLLYHNTVVFKN